MKRVEVAVGVILKGQQVLLSKRHQHQHQGGLWEFPGGKIEAGEPVLDALSRELEEELDIKVVLSSCEHLITVQHDYADKQVCLLTYLVQQFSGEPRGVEGQLVTWHDKADLHKLEFPEANQAILEALLKR